MKHLVIPLEARQVTVKLQRGRWCIPHLELLGLSRHPDRIHHGDKDGYVTQRAPDAACDTDPQRIIGTFRELNCSGVLKLRSCEGANMPDVTTPFPAAV